MPAVKDVGEPGAGEPHARFDGGPEETGTNRLEPHDASASRLPDRDPFGCDVAPLTSGSGFETNHTIERGGAAVSRTRTLGRLAFLVVGVATAAMTSAAPALPVDGAAQDVVAGSGKVTFPDFPSAGQSTTEQFIVSAHSGALGEDPHGQITFHSPLLVSHQAKADVICMTVTGNVARIGGIFEEPVTYAPELAPPNQPPLFRWFELVVQDNGSPGQAADTSNSIIFFDRPRPPEFSPCSFPTGPLLPVDSGNYTVEDALP